MILLVVFLLVFSCVSVLPGFLCLCFSLFVLWASAWNKYWLIDWLIDWLIAAALPKTQQSGRPWTDLWAALRAFNALPQHVRNAPSPPVFRRERKTVLFRLSFPDAIWQCTALYLRARRSVLICHHVLAATNWCCRHCTVVLQQQCDNAT